MKTVFTYLVVFSFLLNAGGKIAVYLNFWVNQDYIAKNLCENREKVEMQCNGKCHLKKQLVKKEKEEKKEDKQVQEEVTTYFFSPFQEIFTRTFLPDEQQDHSSFLVQQKPVGYNPSVFHPPTA